MSYRGNNRNKDQLERKKLNIFIFKYVTLYQYSYISVSAEYMNCKISKEMCDYLQTDRLTCTEKFNTEHPHP